MELLDTDMDESEEHNGSSNNNNNNSSNGNSNNNNNNTSNNNFPSTNGGSEKGSESEFPISPGPYMHSIIPPAVAEVKRWSAYVDIYVTSVAPQVGLCASVGSGPA